MADVVYGEQSVSEVQKQLVAIFQEPAWSGALYIGYPLLSNVEGTIRVDALYVSRESGVVIFDAGHLGARRSNKSLIDEIDTAQNRFFAAMNAKLLETPELLSRRRLSVPILVITLSSHESFESNEVIVSTLDDVSKMIPRNADLSQTQFLNLNSVIEQTATIRPRKRRHNVRAKHSRGAILKDIEMNIANLDAWQKRASIEMPDSPQRIRGLAGSGKTIVLALKAAFLHAKDPTVRIVLTFQTRSLYQQFRRLIRQFHFEFSKSEPDWENISVMHA